MKILSTVSLLVQDWLLTTIEVDGLTWLTMSLARWSTVKSLLLNNYSILLIIQSQRSYIKQQTKKQQRSYVAYIKQQTPSTQMDRSYGTCTSLKSIITLSMVVGSMLQGAMLVHRPSILTTPLSLLPTGCNILHQWGEEGRTQQYGVQN